ncbi:FAD-binding monooxygenase ktnD [Fusarium oxysporum f. sp. albedinis]|nr:FAD-binding monooxygenase ktnD [Fusarium oxysporum f. sp. albedinis]
MTKAEGPALDPGDVDEEADQAPICHRKSDHVTYIWPLVISLYVEHSHVLSTIIVCVVSTIGCRVLILKIFFYCNVPQKLAGVLHIGLL